MHHYLPPHLVLGGTTELLVVYLPEVQLTSNPVLQELAVTLVLDFLLTIIKNVRRYLAVTLDLDGLVPFRRTIEMLMHFLEPDLVNEFGTT